MSDYQIERNYFNVCLAPLFFCSFLMELKSFIVPHSNVSYCDIAVTPRYLNTVLYFSVDCCFDFLKSQKRRLL